MHSVSTRPKPNASSRKEMHENVDARRAMPPGIAAAHVDCKRRRFSRHAGRHMHPARADGRQTDACQQPRRHSMQGAFTAEVLKPLSPHKPNAMRLNRDAERLNNAGPECRQSRQRTEKLRCRKAPM